VATHCGGLTGDELARELVRSAGRVSGGIAATTGGIIAAQELTIAGLLLVPFELAAETALVVATEVKLAAELHHVARRPLPGAPHQRSGGAGEQRRRRSPGRRARARRPPAAPRGAPPPGHPPPHPPAPRPPRAA